MTSEVNNTQSQPHMSRSNDSSSKLSCGIVMPIAAMGDYLASHWLDVHSIIKEAVSLAGYEARLVSESPESTVIIRSIVQNLYSDEIVICDVSGMNPNVMFELGMRLAFDKPVVIIKDDATRFSFDISTIEHLEYPKSLRYQSIQQFKIKLSEKIKGTVTASKNEGYRSFLSNFGSFTVANLKETVLNETEALEKILDKLDGFGHRLSHIEFNQKNTDPLNKMVLEELNSSSKKPYRLLNEVIIPEENINNIDLYKDILYKKYGESVKLMLKYGSVRISCLILTDKPVTESASIETALLHKPICKGFFSDIIFK